MPEVPKHDFFSQVYQVARLIPRGRVTSYGAIAAYLGRGPAFDRAIAQFAESYADQNERDFAAFAAAVASGRLVARTNE